VSKIFLINIILFLSTSVFADFEFYRGVRQMGMGGASIAVVNDETAVLSNPNGLGKLRNYFFTLADPELTASSSGTSTLLGTSIANSRIPEDVYNQLGDATNSPYYFKAQIFPSIVLPNFGIGILGKYEVLALRNADGTYEYNYLNDYSLNLAYNLSFWGGRIKLGFAGRLINRTEFHGTLDPAVDSLAVGSFASEGLGLGVDTGLTFSAPWQYLPTLTFYVRDVGNTSFTMGDGFFNNNSSGTPAVVNQSIDVAVALFPIYSRASRGVFTVEYTGINDTSNVDQQMDRIHIGTEINFLDAYYFRAGYHQNDWTAGFEYSTGIFQWQMATYSEKITIGSLIDRDRRGILKFAVRF
jgi:hypothetical protein